MSCCFDDLNLLRLENIQCNLCDFYPHSLYNSSSLSKARDHGCVLYIIVVLTNKWARNACDVMFVNTPHIIDHSFKLK